MKKPLEKEFAWYLYHQKELVKKHNGKVLAIKGEKVIGVYENEQNAVQETSKTEKLGTFLIQLCEPGTDSYTQTFHSRVTFV